jgi:hypothetical protein
MARTCPLLAAGGTGGVDADTPVTEAGAEGGSKKRLHDQRAGRLEAGASLSSSKLRTVKNARESARESLRSNSSCAGYFIL